MNTKRTAYRVCAGVLAAGFLVAGSAGASLPAEWLRQAHGGGIPAVASPCTPDGADQVLWAPLANSGRPFGRAAGGVVGDRWYVFGAMDSPIAQSLNWTTGHWQLSTEPPLGNCNWAGVSTGEAVYLIGRFCDYLIGPEVQKFVPAQGGPAGTWTRVADYPRALAGVAAAWDGGNCIYAAGGSDLVEAVAAAYRYDLDADAWTPRASLPAPVTYAGGAFLQGRFHVVGGLQDDPGAHYVYDPATDAWDEAAPLPLPNHLTLFSLTDNGSHIISAGGGGGYFIWPAVSTVQVYDPDTDTWTSETPLPAAHGMNSAAVMPDGAVISAGGFNEGFFSQQTFKGTGFPVGGSQAAPPDPPAAPARFALYAPHPNPCNPTTALGFRLPAPGYVSLRVYDTAGRVVITLVEGWQEAGSHEVTFDGSALVSGVYLLHLKAGNVAQTQKLILLR
ncbi:MAG: T9SS C-terminal target domain-containing protein [Candidatus Zixiibacteriota bacterium]|nr:MAG: T9SS C-terminal target domain-containing protein [candidate division Zixibacteria bacterium]